jgi:type II secretory pathway predicted ATPase ExeA
MIERLRAHYGFCRQPFGRDLAPSQLFSSKAHQEAVARLSWLVGECSLGMLTGEVGAGKTVAVRAATSSHDPSRHTVIYWSNPAAGIRGLYDLIVSALGGTSRFHTARLIAEATELMVREHAERNKQVTLVCDEAHLLSAEHLDEIRFLTNLDMDSASPMACVLVGQPTLRRRVRMGSYAALDQRIALRCHIEGMTAKETASYVKHHLALAGRSDTLFSDDAIALIHQTSRGIPRLVNNLAVQSLVAAFADSKAVVDESSARAAVAEITAE